MKKLNRYRIAVRGLIAYQGQYLLLERAKPARGELGFWELPGGGLDFGESPQGALMREIWEETGLHAAVGKPLSVWHYMRGNDVEIIGMTFLCSVQSDQVVLSDEHHTFAWLNFSEIKTKKVFPELLNELKVMSL